MEDPSRLMAPHGAGVALQGGLPPGGPAAPTSTSGDPSSVPPPAPPPHDTGDVLQQIMAITDQSLDEAQARSPPPWPILCFANLSVSRTVFGCL
uniref:Uncharacterized protein n=1 Tax=Meleagris gallopavo TaxID=9103 RepID=A0A803YGY7_MELGA